MNITRLPLHSFQKAMQTLGTEASGMNIMTKKAHVLLFELTGLTHEAMNILKQEAISVGGDFATPRETIKHEGKKQGILIATHSQLERIITKLKIQPFNLKEVGIQLQNHLNTDSKSTRIKPSPSIMAIVNITPDSFYASSRCDSKAGIARIESLLQKEVAYIDIGAASSRPGSEIIEADEEIARLKEICTHIKKHRFYEKTQFSIDTYNPKTATFALEHGFNTINDVSGLSHEQMPLVAAKYQAKVILMHTKGTPKNMQSLTHYDHLISQIDTFFAHKIQSLQTLGVKDIVLDIGFGFAKNSEQNLTLVKHLNHFSHFGFPLLVGASRKNTIGEIIHKPPEERLYGTLALHLLALTHGASILRVHDEDAHIDMLRVFKACYE